VKTDISTDKDQLRISMVILSQITGKRNEKIVKHHEADLLSDDINSSLKKGKIEFAAIKWPFSFGCWS